MSHKKDLRLSVKDLRHCVKQYIAKERGESITYKGEYSKETLMISSGVNIRRSQPHTSPRFSLEDGMDN